MHPNFNNNNDNKHNSNKSKNNNKKNNTSKNNKNSNKIDEYQESRLTKSRQMQMNRYYHSLDRSDLYDEMKQGE